MFPSRIRNAKASSIGVLCLCFVTSVPGLGVAQEVRSTNEVAAGVDGVFAAYDRVDSPGCALGVIHGDGLVYSRGYGMANLEIPTALSPTSVFRIGSTSKQFTAAVMVLAEQRGDLSLDDDIRVHLPEMPEYEVPVTIRMLLHHTSGIRDYLTLMSLAGLRDDDWYSTDEALEMIARQQETNFTPGTEHLYSNSGYFLLSQIIERATGKTLREYGDEHIFRPLGMNHTHFHDDHMEVVANRASGYAPAAAGFDISMTPLDMVGDGGVFTTVEDLRRWDHNFYEPTVGGEAFLEAMLTRGVLTNGDTLDYALGLIHDEYRGLRTVQHGGSFVGFRAEMIRFPEQQVAITVLCNLSATSPTALAHGVADEFLSEFMEASEEAVAAQPAGAAPGEPVELTPAQLQRWVGLYRNIDEGGYIRIEMRDGTLTVALGPGFPMTPRAEDRFDLDVAPVSFEFFDENGSQGFTLVQGGNQSQFAEVEAAVLTAGDASAYAGRYYASELGVEYLVLVEDAQLRIKRGRGDPIPLAPTVADEFTLDGAEVRFERSGGQPSAFVVDAGRVRGIRFERVGG